jgi:hypothetical protein
LFKLLAIKNFDRSVSLYGHIHRGQALKINGHSDRVNQDEQEFLAFEELTKAVKAP